jgi:DNA topoisomerase-1
MKQLIHNGVLIPRLYKPKGLHILCKGKQIRLSPEQEAMAYAWVKKLGTDYVNDRVFSKNFFKDFSAALNFKKSVKPEDFDFLEVQQRVEAERESKLLLSKEDKKKLARDRKVVREANKEKYGYGVVDGVKTEISNYLVEPSSIFMGRGKHPLRGRWKQGAEEEDVVLNLSPDAPVPHGNWKSVVWEPACLWIAKWKDQLTGKMKYVWLADSSRIKQEKEIEKFDTAKRLEKEIDKVREHVVSNLTADDEKRRKVATVCYLIDRFKLRVGDEKDSDEANTVGATTLLSNHISFGKNGSVTLSFIGKDYVKWHKEEILPDRVIYNLRSFTSNVRSPVFDGVRSEDVNAFLSEAMPELTAKVFRTYHATKVVSDYLHESNASKPSPAYEKKHEAKMANLQAAITCNHKRKVPKRWRESLKKKRERLKKLRERIKKKKTPKSKAKAQDALRKAVLALKLFEKTRDYNLGTSLKSYIDPRVYYRWGRRVDFDWRLFYSKALQKKFSWVED